MTANPVRLSFRLEPADLANLEAIRDALRAAPRAGLTTSVTAMIRAALVAGASLACDGKLVETLMTARLTPAARQAR